MMICKKRSAMTLVEVLLALAITVLVAVAIMQLYITSLFFAEVNKEETAAMEHLTNMAEAIRCTPYSNVLTDFPNGVADGPSASTYDTLIGEYSLRSEHITVSYVDEDSDPLEINVQVDWKDKRGADRIRNFVTKRTR